MAEAYPTRRTRLLQSTGQVGADGFTVSQDPNVLYGEYAALSLAPGTFITSVTIEAILSHNPGLFQRALAASSPFNASRLT